MDLTLFVERLLVEANPECPDQQIKSLLMDEHLLKVVSTTCLQSALLKHGYLLFETLGGPSGAHAPLGFVTCVCLLQPSPDNIRLLAQELQKPRFGHYRVVLNGSRDEGVVLILDRDADLVTPLLSRWTYQAMIHELLGIQRNVVKLEDASGAGKPPEQIILSSKYDDFFLNNMFKNFGEIGEVVKKLVKEFQEKVSGHKNIESIGDIKDFIVSYPQFKKISGTVSKHVNVISELSRLVSARNLLNISEIEQTLSCHAPNEQFDGNLQKAHVSVQGLKICHGRTSKHLGFRQSDASHTKVKMDDNLYTQHKPALFWLTESVLQGRLSDELAGDVRGLRPTKKILVYMVGGITYEETLKMYQLNVTYNSNVVIGGCTLWRSKEFCQHLKTISTP
ncbi:hypothetical protein TCAL_06450 [Tigriopus californicus]|uniref:Vacuolar protein sorting-associated protein 45 n=1 Tax=Tigriopus californicus TaxID=6832 RepID=A0A553PLP4_TIGCA|nr:hypothetical protein TCAL_06450 [Tigriopus californicus]